MFIRDEGGDSECTQVILTDPMRKLLPIDFSPDVLMFWAAKLQEIGLSQLAEFKTLQLPGVNMLSLQRCHAMENKK